MNDERLRQVLQAAFPPIGQASPSRDLWPDVARRAGRRDSPAAWLDLALAAAVAGAVVIVPDWLLLLLYHL